MEYFNFFWMERKGIFYVFNKNELIKMKFSYIKREIYDYILYYVNINFFFCFIK